jgi:hypothetical protein
VDEIDIDYIVTYFASRNFRKKIKISCKHCYFYMNIIVGSIFKIFIFHYLIYMHKEIIIRAQNFSFAPGLRNLKTGPSARVALSRLVLVFTTSTI